MNHFGLSATWIFITWMEPCWTTATRHQPNDWESIKVQFLSRHSQRIMDLSVAVQMLQRWHLRAAFFFSNRVTLRQMVGCHTWQNHIGSYSIFNLLSLTIDFESWFREKKQEVGTSWCFPTPKRIDHLEKKRSGLWTKSRNDLEKTTIFESAIRSLKVVFAKQMMKATNPSPPTPRHRKVVLNIFFFPKHVKQMGKQDKLKKRKTQKHDNNICIYIKQITKII